jgi:hypothetical protein
MANGTIVVSVHSTEEKSELKKTNSLPPLADVASGNIHTGQPFKTAFRISAIFFFNMA